MSRKYSNEKARGKHQDAVKLRKMTDDQLTAYVDELYVKGFNEGITYKSKELEKIKGKIALIKGIGPKIQSKIFETIEEMQ